MERDVELQLTHQFATLEAIARDITRRLERIEAQTTLTNGRVSALEQSNASAVAVAAAVAKPRALNLSDLRLYVGIAMVSGGLAVGAALWVLKVAGVL